MGRPGPDGTQVHLVVPVKPLWAAKSRLRGAAGDDPVAHGRLALALALDTIAAAGAARLVGRVLVMSTDPEVAAGLTERGVAVEPDGPRPGLNAALSHGTRLLRRAGAGVVGALQADLPALTAAELDAALTAALAAFAAGAARAFVPDADGTGTTLLLAAPGAPIAPRFGRESARRHRGSGAVALTGPWPGLRRDVDTGADLRAAADLGLGVHTTAALTPCART
ncbi:MAG: 2-phospho-L-lactate guanylyltransferase [Pseudonocardia sp.]